MHERRCSRRFDLKLPCLICVAEDDHPEEILRTETLNISTDGAYFATGTPLPPDTPMSIEVMVQRSAEGQECQDGSCISLNGRVVRSNAAGMAVRFDQQYQITRITRLIAQSRAKASWMEMLTGNGNPTTSASRQMPAPKADRIMKEAALRSPVGRSQLMPA